VLKADVSRPAIRLAFAAGAAVLALALAGCTAGGLESLEVTSPSFASPATAKSSDAEPETGVNPLTAEQAKDIEAADFVPTVKPADTSIPAVEQQADAATGTKPLIDLASKPTEAAQTEAVAQSQAPQAVVPVSAPRETSDAPAEQVATAVNSFAATPEPKKKGFLAGFFSQTPQEAPVMSAPSAQKPKPVIQLAAVDPEENAPAKASLGVERMDALPGVRQSSLFEIKRRDSLDDDSDVDVHEDEELTVQYASAAGLARLAPNGLLKQRESVDVACLKPSLVRMLKQIERRFGRRVVVTSGYRSPEYNKRVRGARRSMHMYCAAADIQLEGVSKWDLANYVRSMPGRGGVGTYCHTNSVHVDVGPERDWNWRCRRRKT
jgi:uncharacterized protein YcbK (DUF882 family)